MSQNNSIRFIVQEPILYRILICKNINVLDLKYHINLSAENLQQSCKTAGLYDLNKDFLDPLNIDHVVFHDNNFNIFTNNSASCMNFKTSSEETSNSFTSNQLATANQVLSELYNTICSSNTDHICETTHNNQEIYIKLYELFTYFCNSSYIDSTVDTYFHQEDGQSLIAIKRNTHHQYKILECDNVKS